MRTGSATGRRRRLRAGAALSAVLVLCGSLAATAAPGQALPGGEPAPEVVGSDTTEPEPDPSGDPTTEPEPDPSGEPTTEPEPDPDPSDPPSAPPVATDQDQAVAVDSTVTIELAVVAEAGDTVTIQILVEPQNGTLGCEGVVCFYSPDEDFVGTDSFSYVATGLAGDSAPATVSLTVRRSFVTPVGSDEPGALRLAEAMVADLDTLAGAELVSVPPLGRPHGTAERGLLGVPTAGPDYAVLSTGSGEGLDETPGFRNSVDLTGPPVRGNTDLDVTVLRVDLEAPPTANCLRLDFRFVSTEYPTFVGQQYNDGFIAEVGESTWSTDDTEILAPDNFAFDTEGEVISINSTGVTGMSAELAAGTSYGGGTTLLRAGTPVEPGQVPLYLSIFDQGDHIFDSAVLVDGVRFVSVEDPATQCEQGAEQSNQPPVVDAGPDVDGDEGEVVTLAGSALDPDGDELTYQWTYEPYSTSESVTCTFTTPEEPVTGFSCTDDGTFYLVLTVSDGTARASDNALVTLTNVAPEVTILSPDVGHVVEEGGQVDLEAAFTDPGSNDTHTCTVDWGDSTTTEGAVEDGVCRSSHAYQYAGTYPITVTVVDKDQGSGTATVDVRVRPPLPQPDAGPDVDGLEGEPGVVLLGSVDEGGGPVSLGLSALVPSAEGDVIGWSYEPDEDVDPGTSCTFSEPGAAVTGFACDDDGTFIVHLTVSDGPLFRTDSAFVRLGNVETQVEIEAPLPGTEVELGRPLEAIVRFSDPGGNDTHSCAVDWGDGTTTVGTTTADRTGTAVTGTCTAEHTYLEPGTYRITVSVTDDDEGTGTAVVEVTVPVPLPPPEAGPDLAGIEGSPVVLAGSVEAAAAVAEGPLVVEWSYEAAEGVDPGATCTFGSPDAELTTFTCDDDGTFTVTLGVSDLLASASDSATVTLANVAAAVVVETPVTGSQVGLGLPVDLLARVADPGANDTHTCVVDWGDGTTVAGLVEADTCSAEHAFTEPGPYAVEVSVLDDDGATGTATLDLVVVDTGEPFAAFTVSPATLAFPAGALGTPSAPLDVTVQNTGNVTLLVSADLAAAGDFDLTPGGCAGLLAPEAECLVAVTLTPAAPGPLGGSVTLSARPAPGEPLVVDPPAVTVPLTGAGLPPTIELSPPVVRPGRVTTATGTGFPPGAQVRLGWDRAAGATVVTAAADGTITAGLVVFPKSPLGARDLVVDVTGLPTLPGPTLLVVPPTGQPPDFVRRG